MKYVGREKRATRRMMFGAFSFLGKMESAMTATVGAVAKRRKEVIRGR